MEATPPASDCAAEALEPEGEWNAYLQAISGFMNGAGFGADLGRRLYGL
jgi:monoamine oxidase